MEKEIIGTWKVTELSGEWLIEEEEKEKEKEREEEGKAKGRAGAGRSPLDSDESDDSDYGDDFDDYADEDGFGSQDDDDERDGEEGHLSYQQTQKKNEELQELLDISALELKLTCDEEGHAQWQLINTTPRNFQNPLAKLRQYEILGDVIYFAHEENSVKLKFQIQYDPRGKLSFVRGAAIMTFQKVVDPPEEFSFADALKGDRPFADVFFTSSEGNQVKAHGVLIEARCPYLLTSEGKELLSKQEAKVIDCLLCFIYTDSLHGLPPESIKQLKTLSTKLSLPRLELLCEDYLQNNAVKNELFQLIADFSEGIDRLTAICSGNFLENENMFRGFLKEATKELCQMFMKFWLITVLYANRKNELTKTEKKELIEFSRLKTIEFLRKGDGLYNTVILRLSAPREILNPLFDAILPDFENLCEFLVEIIASFKEVLEEMPQESKKSKSKGLKKFVENAIYSQYKLKKYMIRTMGRLIEWENLFSRESGESKRNMFRNHAHSFIGNFFLSGSQAQKRTEKLEKFISGKLSSKWGIIVRQMTSKSSSVMTSINSLHARLLPIFQKLVDRLGDPVVTAAAQKLGLLREQKEGTSISKEIEIGTLGIDVKKYMRSNQYADMSFVVMGTRIPAHRILVACRSPHFNRSLQSGMREANEREIVIPDISIEGFNLLLEYFYGGVNLENVEVDLLVEILKISDEYEINPLKEICGEILRTMVDAENAAVFLDIGNTYQATNLKIAAKDFITQNIGVLETEDFKNLDPKLKEEIEANISRVAEANPRPGQSVEDPDDIVVEGDLDQSLVNSMLEIVGEDADLDQVIRCLTAADKDLNRAVNFFYSGL